MPTLPWLAGPAADGPTTVVVMASRFSLRRMRDVPRFLADSLLVHRQVRSADGAVGVSLVARPLRREFLTLSAWRDRASLDALVRTAPHARVMRRHRAAMAESTFTFWDAPAASLPITWDEADRRLAAQREGGRRAQGT